jgi:hypothetical protein
MGVDGVDQTACRGGSVAVESVAALRRPGWQASGGMGGKFTQRSDALQDRLMDMHRIYLPDARPNQSQEYTGISIPEWGSPTVNPVRDESCLYSKI